MRNGKNLGQSAPLPLYGAKTLTMAAKTAFMHGRAVFQLSGAERHSAAGHEKNGVTAASEGVEVFKTGGGHQFQWLGFAF